MRRQKPIIIANWKMNLTLQESVFLAKKIKRIPVVKNIELVVCPSFTSLEAVARILKKSKVKLGAQNCWWQDRGAFNGEISPLMLKELGCQYVILGHSERRRYFGEDYDLINKKVKATLAEDLIPIICLGEEWQDRQKNRQEVVIEQQVKKVLADLNDLTGKKVILSYEPFWSISTSGGRIATASEVEYRCQIIKQTLIDLYGPGEYRQNFQLIYGGSVDFDSIKDFLNLEIIEGFLIGTASLKIDSFKKLLRNFSS